MNKTCITCHKNIKGRADKKYCSAICKAKFNRTKLVPNPLIRDTNRILLENHNILNKILSKTKSKQIKINRIELAKLGFSFDYCTRVYLNSQGKWYRYVYNYKWMEFSDQHVLILRK